MAMVETLERRGNGSPAEAGGARVGRRRALPNSRAVVGALLITASVFGVFWSWSASTRPPTTPYVVAARDLVVGDTIEAADLRVITAELPDTFARTLAFGDIDAVVGAVVVGPIRKGELIQTGVIARRSGSPGMREISFAIDESRALSGRLRAGQAVDVVATFGAGGDTYTTTVVRHAIVLSINQEGGALGSRSGLTITLGLEPHHDPLALAHALNVGDVFLLGSAGGEGSGPPPGPEAVYRAPGAERTEAPS